MSALRLARAFTAPRPRDQVRRRLPRPRRPVPRRGGLGARDARHPGLAGRAVGASPPTRSSSPTTTSTRAAAAVERYGEDLAAIFVEPVAGNMGCVPPAPGFLEALRALCDASGALLVFDEVITGFRVARGGAQERFGVTPDLTDPRQDRRRRPAARGVRRPRRVMSRLAPVGDVYQAGTLSGNPLATAAGLSVLRRLRDPRGLRRARAARRAARGGPRAVRPRAAGRRDADALRRARPSRSTRFASSSTPTRYARALPPPARARHLRRAEPVRVPLPVARARRRRDRRDGRRGRAFDGARQLSRSRGRA